MHMSRNCVLIIPSLNPDEKLVRYLKELAANGFHKILLVNDGSSTEAAPVFEQAGSLEECDLFVHTVNMGKGRSLKDAFNIYCQKYAKDYLGVITADADGQHTVQDIIRLDTALAAYQNSLLLGVRDFDSPSVPWKSSFGNKITRNVLRFLIGGARQADEEFYTGTCTKAISDTQTGLRAIPNRLLKDYLALPGERFEYETNMLIQALHSHTPVKEIRIQTVYMDNNSQTHFRPIADSMAIYRQIFATFFKYTLASLSSFLIDYGIYSLLLLLLGFLPLAQKIWICAATARILSSLYNYAVNKAVVFQNKLNARKTLERYYLLCIIQLCCSAQLVWLLCSYTGLSAAVAKLIVDTLLFVASYYIQKNWVFQSRVQSAKPLRIQSPGLKEG